MCLVAEKFSKAAVEIDGALAESSQTLASINESVAVTQLQLDVIKYDIGQRSPCFMRVAKRSVPDKEQRLVGEDRPFFARIQQTMETDAKAMLDRTEAKEENPFSVMYRKNDIVGVVEPTVRKQRKSRYASTAARRASAATKQFASTNNALSSPSNRKPKFAAPVSSVS